MRAFSVERGIAAPLDEANVDTNQLCPTRFNKVPRGERFAQILLHDRRFRADGSEIADFLLNQEPYRHAPIIVAGRNFGVGSSRETAVFGLVAFGVRSVIAPSFGDIFYNNCLKNGVLPVTLPAPEVAALMHALQAQRGAELTIDLPQQTVTAPDGTVHRFEIRALTKRRLLRGLDDLALTNEFRDDVRRFEESYRRANDWL
jgi:3-isopropylmalate/(R)-2-methylmalate dehydratase small subunit